ncbi:unnamed protein product [Nezara viridula]|uniref:Uncharacterized protein n=1 Tax=Nezara viridula TaxID=85310 RepID=A0A9P0E644_NEZVI|nr:unnamed protein product [Nezara viridula]
MRKDRIGLRTIRYISRKATPLEASLRLTLHPRPRGQDRILIVTGFWSLCLQIPWSRVEECLLKDTVVDAVNANYTF